MKQKLKTCCGRPYKLLIVDLNMPRMGGIELINEIKRGSMKQELSAYKDSFFVLSTAQGDRNTDKYINEGFDDYRK